MQERRAGARTDRTEGGEAHVAEWHRVGAKRVLGDVGRGEGPAENERMAGIVLMVGVTADRQGVGNDGREDLVWERRRRR